VNARPWALVPAKSFARSKSRLASVLGARQREELARGFLEHVLDAVAASDAIEGTMVVTDCDDVADVAMARGAVVVRDEARRLGAIVDRALARLEARGAHGAIVLMSDLPEIAAEDVRDLADALARDAMVIAPDLRCLGTNALAVSLAPSSPLPTCFGHADSFARHLACAQAVGARVRVYKSERLGFDVDEPSDFEAFLNRKRSSRVSAA
jgi:2-phospho-L-lactate guanylyltransferase